VLFQPGHQERKGEQAGHHHQPSQRSERVHVIDVPSRGAGNPPK
jgi:hypothetical protein